MSGRYMLGRAPHCLGAKGGSAWITERCPKRLRALSSIQAVNWRVQKLIRLVTRCASAGRSLRSNNHAYKR